jgi:hypothetical protein
MPEIEHKMTKIIHKLDISEKEFTKDDKTLLDSENKVSDLNELLKGDASFKTLPHTKSKELVVQISIDNKKNEKRV